MKCTRTCPFHTYTKCYVTNICNSMLVIQSFVCFLVIIPVYRCSHDLTHNFLRYVSDRLPQRPEGGMPQIASIQQDAPWEGGGGRGRGGHVTLPPTLPRDAWWWVPTLLWVVQSEQKREYARLPTPRRPNQRHRLPRLHLKKT